MPAIDRGPGRWPGASRAGARSRALPAGFRRAPLLALASLIVFVIPARAQVVQGTVIDPATGNGMPAADVALVASDGTPLFEATTDSAGRFAIPVPRPGRYTLRIAVADAVLQTHAIDVGTGEAVEVQLEWAGAAALVAPLRVISRRRGGTDARLAGFHRRRESGQRTGQGWFLTREELVRQPVADLQSLLMHVPRAPVGTDMLGRTQFRPSSRGMHALSAQCGTSVLVNGSEVRLAAEDALDVIVDADQLEAVEVYRTPTEMPEEFRRSGACSALVLWVQGGAESGAGGWRRIVAGSLGIVAVLWFGFGR